MSFSKTGADNRWIKEAISARRLDLESIQSTDEERQRRQANFWNEVNEACKEEGVNDPFNFVSYSNRISIFKRLIDRTYTAELFKLARYDAPYRAGS